MGLKSIRLAQLSLSALCVCLSASIVGTASDAFSAYKQQRDALNPWWLPLWPEHFNTSSTFTLIGVASTITFLHLVYLVAVAVPRFSISGSPRLAWLLTMLVTLPSSLAALIAIGYTHVLNRDSDNSMNRDTIMTWTCRFRNSHPAAGTVELSRNMTNAAFGKLCDESRFAYYAMIPVLLVQFVMIVISFVEWRVAAKARKAQEKGYGASPESHSPVELSIYAK